MTGIDLSDCADKSDLPVPRSSLNNLHLHLSLGLPGFVAPEFLVEEVSGAVHGCRECMHEAEALVVVVGGARAAGRWQ